MNHGCKRYIEEYLIESGLNYTIMQPSHFLDMFPVESLLQQPEPTYNATFDPNTTFSFTVLRDLAEAFVKVIEEREKHYLAEYMICSTCPTSYTDVINMLSQLSNTHINVVTQEFYEGTRFVQNMVSNDSKDCHRVTRDGIQRLQLYHNYYGINGNTNVLEWLIGRKPTAVEEFLRDRMHLSGLKQR